MRIQTADILPVDHMLATDSSSITASFDFIATLDGNNSRHTRTFCSLFSRYLMEIEQQQDFTLGPWPWRVPNQKSPAR